MSEAFATPRARAFPRDDTRPGHGFAVIVNANAKRGGRRIAVQIGQRLPGANVRLTRSVQEIGRWLATLDSPRCILVAGGDGTAIAFINELARLTPAGQELPVLGMLPLGTGNGWAHACGAPKLDRCLEILGELPPGPVPTHRFGVFECDGTLAHFAGSGWDAIILDDYKKQLAESGPARFFTKSVYGYVTATLLRTAPRVTLLGNPRLVIENLGDEVFTITADRKVLKLHGKGKGSVIYDGPAGVASVGTSPFFGYNFRAFPFAERMPGMMNVRVYDRPAPIAVANIPRLWAGEHPLPGAHDWFATAIRMTFSRAMPLQIGGDSHGARQSVEYRISPRPVDMLDWRRLY